jgi:hypothetical protein
MEYKRRSLSSVLEEDIFDIEKQPIKRRATSSSIDEEIEEYTEYVYNGTFNLSSMIFSGLKKLICPCLCKKSCTK